MREELKEAVEKIKGFKPETLKRQGRDYEFTDVSTQIKSIYEAISQLENSDDWLSSLPPARLQGIKTGLETFANTVEAISNFSPSQPDPQTSRDSLADGIVGQYKDLYKSLIEPLKLDSVYRRSSGKSVKKIQDKAETDLSEIRKVKKEVDTLLESAKKATAQTGITAYSEVFEVQSKEHKKASWVWLATSGLLVIILIFYLGWLTFETIDLIIEGTDPLHTFTLFLARIFPATVVYYLLYQVIKNFNVNMHLYTLNKHRANVLKTFESFVNSTDEPNIRDTVLVKAAEAIFDARATGYLSGKDSRKGGLELIQSINNLKNPE